MKKIYYLSTCSTCARIIKEIKPTKDFVFQDIKTDKITPKQLDEMKELSGSYASLFSKAALKFRVLGLHEQTLEEQDYRQHILDEYTFLRRPVIILNGKIFIGNSPQTIVAAKAEIAQK